MIPSHPLRILLLILVSSNAAQITDIRNMPNYRDQAGCVKCALWGCSSNDIWDVTGCADTVSPVCLCNHFSQAMLAASSLVNSYCSGNTADIFSATSILNDFCAQQTISLIVPTAPMPSTQASRVPTVATLLTSTITTNGRTITSTIIPTQTMQVPGTSETPSIRTTTVNVAGIVGAVIGGVVALATLGTIVYCIKHQEDKRVIMVGPQGVGFEGDDYT